MGFLKELLNILKLVWELPRLSKEMKRVQRMRRGRPFPKRKPRSKKYDGSSYPLRQEAPGKELSYAA